MIRSARTVVATAALAPLALLGLGACSTSVHHSAKVATTGAAAVLASGHLVAHKSRTVGRLGSAGRTIPTLGHGAGPEETPSPGGGQGARGGGTSSTGVPSPGGGSAGSTGVAIGAPGGAAPAPQFMAASMSVPVDCIVGTLVTPHLTWHTTGASGMALSIDDPEAVGSFGTYGANGTLAMPSIACDGPIKGSTAAHRYDLFTTGGSGTPAHHTLQVTMMIEGVIGTPVTMPPASLPPYTIPPIVVPCLPGYGC